MNGNLREIKTRKQVNCVIFGTPQEFGGFVLPSYEFVMKYYLFVKHDLKPSAASKEPTVAEIGEIVAQKLEDLWHKASIPIVSHTRILQMIRNYHDKYRNMLKSFKGKGSRESYQLKLKAFQADARKLFDISACKCKEFNFCSCPREKKVPVEERPFLLDQRSKRKMIIGSLDIEKTKQLTERMKRKIEEEAREAKVLKEKESQPSTSKFSDSEPEIGEEAYSDPDFNAPVPKFKKRKTHSIQMRTPLPNFAKVCDRTGISDRSAAAIASAVLEDVGLIKNEDKTKVIDRMKVRRQRKNLRSNLQKQSRSEPLKIRGLYFDGRRDKTLIQEKKENKYYRKTITEEHYVLVEEPGSKYIGHISPTSGSADSISKSILEFLEDDSIDSSNLRAIGCDGTVVNTGQKGGVIRKLEIKLNCPLQWNICQLHGNELPFRHLFQYIDGSTKGPKSFEGPIGKKLEGCVNFPVVKFQSIGSNLPEVVIDDLSTDQKYLLEICLAISSGHCSQDLAQKNPGKIGHARWLTTANHVLRLYVGTKVPSNQLNILATFILKVYAPMWFRIKMKPSCKDGAKHLWETIQFSRYLSADLRNVVDPVIQRNGFFAHSENILLSMITDDRQHIRELGIRRILKARSQRTNEGIRIFRIPEINFDAKEYFNLIDWTEISEPPLTFDIADDELKKMIQKNEEIATIDFPRFPSHTQAVERSVKLVTEASAAVCGANSRDGFIRARLESRKTMPNFATKSDYKTEM